MKVTIIEDNGITREALFTLLKGVPEIASIVMFSNAEDALEKVNASNTDVLVVDLDLPGMHGTEFIEKIKGSCPSIDILVHTIFEDRQTVFTAIKAGAAGYLLKGSTPEEVISSVLNVRQGGAPMSPRIARKIITEFQKTLNTDHEIENPLSVKEVSILKLVSLGLSYKEIAEELSISPHTVHTHIKNIYEKLQSRGRRAALSRARQIGIL